MFVIHKHQVCGVFVVAAKWTITTSNADSPKRSYMETLQLIVSAKTFFPNKITVTSSGIKTWACICVCAHLCPTLCDPMDCNPPGSSVHGILQGRILGWVAISSSSGSSQQEDGTWISCVSCIASGCFSTEPWRKPMDTSLLEGHHPTHCNKLMLQTQEKIQPIATLTYLFIKSTNIC